MITTKPLNFPSDKKNLLIVGIGNSLKSDDGAGPELIKRLRGVILSPAKSGINSAKNLKNIELLDTGSAPENYTKKIKDFKPETIVFIDAVEMKEQPGTVKIIEEEKITASFFTTHNIPLNLFLDYIKKETKAEIIFIGIQPKSTKFSEGLSEPVKRAVETLVEELVVTVNF